MKPSFLGSILFFRGVPEGHHVYTGYLHSLTTCQRSVSMSYRLCHLLTYTARYTTSQSTFARIYQNTCNIHNSQCIYHINIMCLNMYTIHEHTHTIHTLNSITQYTPTYDMQTYLYQNCTHQFCCLFRRLQLVILPAFTSPGYPEKDRPETGHIGPQDLQQPST